VTLSWEEARRLAYEAGRDARLAPVDLPLDRADGATLATPLTTLTELPAFPTSSVDGYAVRGEAPWKVVGEVLAGSVPGTLGPGEALRIATGAMVPAGTEHIIRVEDSTTPEPGYVTGTPRRSPDWRNPGEEAGKGEELLPAGTPVTPGVVGLAASCGYDRLLVHPRPSAALLVFGDELLVTGTPGNGRVRDSLGPSFPAWLRRLGADPVPGLAPVGPIQDTLQAHISALRRGLEAATVVCTTGGTMHGPVDHLHPALEALGASYVVNTVKVRPGFPMLLARVGDGWVAGLPGNPQSAVIALFTLVVPLIAGLTGRRLPEPPRVRLAAPVPGRGDFTHLALVRVTPTGEAYPVAYTGSAMLRGVAVASGFAVIPPGTQGQVGDEVELLPLSLMPGELP